VVDLHRRSIPVRVIDLVERCVEFDALLVPGYIDRDQQSRVVLFPQLVFLGFGSGFLRFGIDEATGQLRVGESAEEFLPPELAGEPSISPIFVDLTANYLGDGSPAKVRSTTLYTNEDSDPERGNFRGVVIEFEGGDGISFDPFAFSGIRIGTALDFSTVLNSQPDIDAAQIFPR